MDVLCEYFFKAEGADFKVRYVWYLDVDVWYL